MSTSEPHPQAGVVGFQLSALRAYGTEAGTIQGVGFWPRAAARVIDLLVASAQTPRREACRAEAGLSWHCFSQSWLNAELIIAGLLLKLRA
jgi:hypothetical protein